MRFILIACLITGCSIAPAPATAPVNSYPAEFRTSFLNECSTGNGAQPYAKCVCLLDGFQREYGYTEFVTSAYPRIADGTAKNDDRIMAIVNRCK